MQREGDVAVELGVVGEVDALLRALAEEALDPIAARGDARRRRVRGARFRLEGGGDRALRFRGPGARSGQRRGALVTEPLSRGSGRSAARTGRGRQIRAALTAEARGLGILASAGRAVQFGSRLDRSRTTRMAAGSSGPARPPQRGRRSSSRRVSVRRARARLAAQVAARERVAVGVGDPQLRDAPLRAPILHDHRLVAAAEDPFVRPVAQRGEQRQQRLALLGEAVLEARARLADVDLLEDPVGDEPLEPVRRGRSSRSRDSPRNRRSGARRRTRRARSGASTSRRALRAPGRCRNSCPRSACDPSTASIANLVASSN